MDDDLRNAFATLSAQISVVATDLRTNTALTADLTRGVAEVRTEQKAIRGEVQVLQKAVFGSEPPPAPPIRPMAESVTEHEGEIATLAGQVIAARAELADVKIELSAVKKLNVEQTETLKKIAASVGGFLGNPLVRRIATAAGLALLAYLNRGLVLK